MTTIEQLTATAVTMGVWIAAVGSAAALTYDLNRAPHLASDAAFFGTVSEGACVTRAARVGIAAGALRTGHHRCRAEPSSLGGYRRSE
jgi:hypothetical protein